MNRLWRSLFVVSICIASLSSILAGPRDYLAQLKRYANTSWLVRNTNKNIRFVTSKLFLQHAPATPSHVVAKEFAAINRKAPHVTVSESLQAQVDSACKDARIPHPVIGLATQDIEGGCVFKHFENDQHYILINDRKSLHQQLAALYHEVGHIAHGDTASRKHYCDLLFFGSYVTLSALSIYTTMVTTNHGLLASTLLGYVPMVVLRSLVEAYRYRCMEEKADAYAYTLLIETGKTDVALAKIMVWLEHRTTTSFFSLKRFSKHPDARERARMGLRILCKHGIDIRDESLFPCEWTDDQKQFYRDCLDAMPEFQQHDQERIKKT